MKKNINKESETLDVVIKILTQYVIVYNAELLGWYIKSFEDDCIILSKKKTDMTQIDKDMNTLIDNLLK